MPQGVVRQADQYGLQTVADQGDRYASVPEQEVADLLRAGPRIHAGTMDRRAAQETPDPDYEGLAW